MEETYSMKREDRRGARSSKRQSPQFKVCKLYFVFRHYIYKLDEIPFSEGNI